MNTIRNTLLTLALAISLAACEQGSTDTPPSPAPAGPSPGTPPSGATGIDPVNGFQTTNPPITRSTVNDGAGFVLIADGTTATSFTITVDTRERRYVVIRPVNSAPNVPVLLMLHPTATTPETMANLANVSDYVLTQGFWAVLPQAIGGTWDDDPSSFANLDIPFMNALLDRLYADPAIDDTRIYATGFSSGGFMTERMACELSPRIAAFAIASATLRGSQASVCVPAVRRPKVYFLGTSDAIVAYNGVFSGTPNGLYSAADTLQFWRQQQGCGGIVSTTLPNRANDGTTVQRDEYTGCGNGTALQLYTIYNGGHAWPGGDPSFVGQATQDIAATGLLWLFARGYRR
ncbi:hypothetical protein [Nevskia sp.]|uniref:alpha/beta hydrolase family esterase n=1 Tax=Nevskia sp. TaxID=1929292 RepID=UPI0025ECE0B4|nr:hypothetical protein [Nevskia sp.]